MDKGNQRKSNNECTNTSIHNRLASNFTQIWLRMNHFMPYVFAKKYKAIYHYKLAGFQFVLKIG